MRRRSPLSGGLGLLTVLAVLAVLSACSQSVKPAAAPATAPAPASAGVTTPPTAPPSSASPVVPVRTAPTTPAVATTPALASIESAICAAAFPSGVGKSRHCAASNAAVSTVDPTWVRAAVGLYDAQGGAQSDVAAVIYNVRTHRLIGPTTVGFCGEGGGGVAPGYVAVPATVLTGFGLHPCAAPTKSTATLTNIAGTWGAHEVSLVISSAGTAHMKYADLTACPTCSFATAPLGTLTFVLSAVTNKLAKGKVTASSDAKNYAVGEPVVATITAGSPGQLLRVDIGGRELIFCNRTSAGQCGA